MNPIRTYLISSLAVFLLYSCRHKQPVNENINRDVLVNVKLSKLESDTLHIWSRRKQGRDAFRDEDGISRLSNDTIFVKCYRGFMQTDNIDITIFRGKFEVVLGESNCTYHHKYRIINQHLELNKSSAQIGDTLIGKLFCKGIYVSDSANNLVDTTTISGKFKLRVRGKYFDYDSLEAEHNYTALLNEFSNKRPDTVTQLRLEMCGLTSLPMELEKFKNLEFLVLSRNDFKNADLSLLCKFKKLTHLEIQDCNLVTFPESIFCLKNLETLDLAFNDITVLPKQMFTLTKIKELQLCGNLLTNIPNEILNLKNLQMFEISGEDLRNNILKLPPNFFKILNKLTEFYPPHFMDESEYKDYREPEDLY